MAVFVPVGSDTDSVGVNGPVALVENVPEGELEVSVRVESNGKVVATLPVWVWMMIVHGRFVQLAK